jgi:hypothetical protein
LRNVANRVTSIPEAKLSEDDLLAAKRLMKEREEANPTAAKRRTSK